MVWAAREGLFSLFGIFAANAIVFVGLDKTLPYTAEAIAGIVTITTAAIGITSARAYFNDRQAWQHAGQSGVTVNYTPGSLGAAPPSSPPPGA